MLTLSLSLWYPIGHSVCACVWLNVSLSLTYKIFIPLASSTYTHMKDMSKRQFKVIKVTRSNIVIEFANQFHSMQLIFDYQQRNEVKYEKMFDRRLIFLLFLFFLLLLQGVFWAVNIVEGWKWFMNFSRERLKMRK